MNERTGAVTVNGSPNKAKATLYLLTAVIYGTVMSQEE